MRSAAPAGISLLNYLGKRGLARLEPSWSAPLFFWRFSGISKTVCILCIAAAIFNRNSPPLAAWLRSAGFLKRAVCKAAEIVLRQKPETQPSDNDNQSH